MLREERKPLQPKLRDPDEAAQIDHGGKRTREPPIPAAPLNSDEVQAVLRGQPLPARPAQASASSPAETQRRALRHRTWLWVPLAMAGMALGGGGYAYWRQRQLEAIVAANAVLTRATEATTKSTAWRITELPDIWLDVNLAELPQGRAVDLTCDWVAPTGEIAHQNHWRTKPVTGDLWPTHCHHRFTPGVAPGSWQVVMKQDGRPLVRKDFTLEK